MARQYTHADANFTSAEMEAGMTPVISERGGDEVVDPCVKKCCHGLCGDVSVLPVPDKGHSGP